MVKAKVVGHMIFDVIDRVPEIRDHENSGEKFEISEGIHFQNVAFRYPTAPEKVRNVFDSVSFKIRAGETTAIVGPSGSGKSTIVQMIERYYQPLAGESYLDNMNIKDVKLKNLRESIGYVSQEPVLIMGSIKDNILLGNRDASD
jgi:ATP-binding cassette subfamily B (MDR/TAP) protein 1